MHCQRIFTSRLGSRYFEVRQPAQEKESGGNRRDEDDSDDEAAWARAWQQAQAHWEEADKQAAATVQEADRDQANLWLERTQWQKYLVGKNREELLRATRKPGGEEEDRKNKNRRWKAPGEEEDNSNEPIETAVWEAMEKVARISQESVAKRAGVSMRM